MSKSIIQATADTGRPNVLFVIVDDMNGYGFYNKYPGVKMPYLDKLQKQSVVFDHAYCAVPKCVPSRAAVLSGLPANITGAYLNASKPWKQSRVLSEIVSLPECFKDNGYTTFGRGKIFHNNPPEERFKAMWDNEVYSGGFKPFPDPENQVQGRFWGIQAFADKEFPDVMNSDAVMEFLNKDHDKPFFITLGIYRPHTPFTAPQRFFDMYDLNEIILPPGYKKNDTEDIPEMGKRLIDKLKRFRTAGTGNEEMWKKMIWAYLACNTFADWSVGRVIETLDAGKYADNTIVVLWSDNGYHCGEKNHWEKSVPWELGVKTPMLIRIPNMKNAGKVCSLPVNLIDIYPTLVDYCGIDPPSNPLAGKSLRPLLEKPDKFTSKPVVSILGKKYTSVRDKRYRYIQYPDGTEELYDHKNDNFEHNNLAGKWKYKLIKDKLARHVPKIWNSFYTRYESLEKIVK